MAILERANDVTERQMEEVSKNISAMKATMFSAGESDAARESATVLAYEVRTPLVCLLSLVMPDCHGATRHNDPVTGDERCP